VSGFLAFFLALDVLQVLEGFGGRVIAVIAAVWALRRLWQQVEARRAAHAAEVSAQPQTA
jgi:hypothetical protein